jgi:hypothetical protein
MNTSSKERLLQALQIGSGRARPVRAPRGVGLHCKGWQQEAALRMLCNNLDPECGEKPDELIVYGGTGRAESAGINRHREGDERAPHKRRSCSIMAPSHVRVVVRLHVKQLTGESVGQPLSSEITHSGCRPRGPEGKATL